MAAFVTFVVSLVLIISLFIMKGLEIYYGRKIFLENIFLRSDAGLFTAGLKIKYWWSHINFKNIRLIFFWIIVNIRKLVIITKRRFDHQQSHFFVKRDISPSKNKESVSFFLKNVSDYKKSLREGKGSDETRS